METTSSSLINQSPTSSPNLKRKIFTKYLSTVSPDPTLREYLHYVGCDIEVLKNESINQYDDIIRFDRNKLSDLKNNLFNHILSTMEAALIPDGDLNESFAKNYIFSILAYIIKYFKDKHQKKNLYLVSELSITMPPEIVNIRRGTDIGGKPDFIIYDREKTSSLDSLTGYNVQKYVFNHVLFVECKSKKLSDGLIQAAGYLRIGNHLNDNKSPSPKLCLITTGTKFQFLSFDGEFFKLYEERDLLGPNFRLKKDQFFKCDFVDVVYQSFLDFYNLEI